MAPSGGMLAPMALRAIRQAIKTAAEATRNLQNKLAEAAKTSNQELAPITVRVTPRQPAAVLRQAAKRSNANYNSVRWSSTQTFTRYVTTTAKRYIIPSTKPTTRSRSTQYNASAVGRAFAQFPGRAPFAHTLRPNLTGGALPRTASGYAVPGAGRIGGQRFFSHAPATQAQVVQNVSQAMRAFWLSGQRARFDGVGASGEKRWRSVGAVQEETRRKLAKSMRVEKKEAAGSVVDFRISPTVTALGPFAGSMKMSAAEFGSDGAALNEEGFLDVLSVDFARQLKDLAAIMADLKKLASLGNLPIALEGGNVLRVRFPGVDAESVNRLCEDLGVQRGIITQDADFVTEPQAPMALRFPYAPDDVVMEAEKLTSPGGSLRSHDSDLSSISEVDPAMFGGFVDVNPWLPTSSEEDGEEGYESMSPLLTRSDGHRQALSSSYEGVEGVYKFLEQCDKAKGRFPAVRV